MNSRKRQKCYLACPFYRQGQFPLVFGAVAGYSPGNDLASLRNEITKGLRILVIYPHIGIYAETANLAPCKCTSFTPDDHGIFSLSYLAAIRSAILLRLRLSYLLRQSPRALPPHRLLRQYRRPLLLLLRLRRQEQPKLCARLLFPGQNDHRVSP